LTQDEALQLLEMTDGHEPDAIRSAYAARASDLSQRIASAPIPALRDKFEQQAERLRQARDRLLGDPQPRNDPSPLTLTKQLDLPARGPSSMTSGTSEPIGMDNGVTDLGLSHGQVLADRYEIRGLLGAGGMGQVFSAFDRVRQEEIAIKILLPHLISDPKARDRFLNEAKIASNLSHPHIVRVYDVHQTERFTFLTMERLQGRSLRDEIGRRAATAERFSVAEVRDIAEPLCDALAYAHKLTVHRDVKPENIWLGDDGTVKLMDFGIARLLRPSQFTSTGLALGTAYYMAPEQLRGQEVDHRADQFAMGVILYELLTGEIPQGVIQSPHRVRRSVPAGLSEAVMKALAGDSQKRHADMAALRRAMTARSGGGMGRRAALSAAAAIALLLGAGITYPSWRPVVDRLYAETTGGRPPTGGAAPVPAAPGAEEKAAEVAYRKEAAGIDELKAQAEAVGVRIESESKGSPGEVAEQVADLWRRHTRRREWLEQAEQSLARARAMEQERAFVKAEADIKAAAAAYRRPQQWLATARQALGSIERTRSTLVDRLAQFPASTARTLSAWPESLTSEVEDKLADGGGSEGLAEAQRIAGRLPEIEKLLSLRQEVVTTARLATASEQVDELRARSEEAAARLQEADGALIRDRLGDARRLYTAAANLERTLLTELNRHVDGLISSATGALEAGRFEAAEAKVTAALKLRPGDDAATELARRVEVGARIAKVRAYERSGDRDEALTALAELRRQKPDDPDVRKLMSDYLEKIVADGRALLRADRYDDAIQEFQRIRTLRPGDKELMDQLAGEVETRREAAPRLAAERDEAKKQAIQLRIAQEQEAQEQAAAERRRLAAERRRLAAERRRLEAERAAAWRAAQAAARRPVKQTNTFGAAGTPAQGGGIFVLVSYAGTPAANLGLEYSDVIYTINGWAVNTEAEYFAAVRSSPDDMTFTFRDCRTGTVRQATVRLDR